MILNNEADAITVNDISKCYTVFANHRSRLLGMLLPRYRNNVQNVWALKNINFTIRRGESVAIIGRNGSGKSTLLEIIARTLTATTGRISINGRVSALLELGSGFNLEYTGRDNVILNGLLLGLSKQEILNRFQEIEDFAEIGVAINRPVKTYSSGMLMRLAFAVQALCEPDILIIDEALSVGDFFFQQKCLRHVIKLCAQGVTVLFVSHDLGVVRDLCPRVLYLKQGCLVFDGSVGDAMHLFFNEGSAPVACEAKLHHSVVTKFELLKHDAVWSRENRDATLTAGSLLAVAIFNEDNQPSLIFKMGATVKITVAYVPHQSYVNHITVGLTNKYGALSTATGSGQLGLHPIKHQDSTNIMFFDLWMDMLLEAGSYSITITLGYATGVNLGERLDQTPAIGPLQLTWDYGTDVAPFVGLCGLPAKAAFRTAQA